ncbi:MAG TPA: M15 family metallopeptidase [Massilibacterium sp.]|nr:M15 family metallopeptidase [Massilibacterium sp.]
MKEENELNLSNEALLGSSTTMNLSYKQFEFLKDVCTLIQHVANKGWKVTGGELDRTIEQQKIYFESGKSKTMESLHLDRLAIDLNFFNPEGELTYKKKDLQWIGDFWESLSPQNEWGGNWEFTDTPHFQRNK